jgi:hypothetical protein
VLEQDLILTPDKDGIAHITQDDLGNTIDRVGGPYSNYNPHAASPAWQQGSQFLKEKQRENGYRR